jgi:hypothetical protein
LIEKYIKEKSGIFKLVIPPTVIGAKDEKDIEDIIANVEDDKISLSSDEEEDEGMGDFILDGEEEEEQPKEEAKKAKKAK